MKTLCSFLLLSVLVLWVELPAKTLKPKPGKPGICPRDRCICLRYPKKMCRNDFSCQGSEKCCFSCCAMRCVIPEEVRPGSCPPVSEIGCLKLEEDKCKMDADCPQPKKCCYQPCFQRCMDPVKRKN